MRSITLKWTRVLIANVTLLGASLVIAGSDMAFGASLSCLAVPAGNGRTATENWILQQVRDGTRADLSQCRDKHVSARFFEALWPAAGFKDTELGV